MAEQGTEKDKAKKKYLIVFVAVSDAIFGVIGCLLIAFGVLIMTNYIWNDMDLMDGLMRKYRTSLWICPLFGYVTLAVAREPAVIILCLGSALVLLTLLGFVNCCDEDTTLALVVNVLIISVLVLSEIVLCVLFLAGQFTPAMKDKLNDTLADEYFGAEGKYDISVAWNFIMLELECCGLQGYEDFQYATKWVRNYTRLEDGVQAIVSLATPLACCKFIGDFPHTADYVDVEKCISQSSLHSNNSNFNQGCWEAVHNYLRENNYNTIGFSTTVALLALQGLLWIGIIVSSGLRIHSAYKKNQANKINAEPEKGYQMEQTNESKNQDKQLIHVKPEARLNSFIFGET